MPFETVFARLEKRKLEKRRMLLQKKTFYFLNKEMNKMQLQNCVNDNNDDEDNYNDEVGNEEAMMKSKMMKLMMNSKMMKLKM